MAALAETGELFPFSIVDAMMPEVDGITLIERLRQTPAAATTAILMLSSAGRREDVARCRELGVARYLTKPVRRADLLAALLEAAGSQAASPRRVGGPRATAPAAPAPGDRALPAPRSLRVLVAEDNSVNQRVVMRLLEKQGHRVTLADNGREALSALGREAFDVVLMDVQMPEMSGYEATAAIRAREASGAGYTPGGHVPIIAMTAHAMKGDREKCLEAGMDGYVTKPLTARDLADALAAHACEAATPPAECAAAPR